MAWLATDWDSTDWYAVDWFRADELIPGKWFEADWFGTDWHGTDWYPDGTSGGTFGFVQAGLLGTLTVSGFAGVYKTSFVRQGTRASLGVTGRNAGFYPDPGGILANDSDPDGDPLSYEIVTQPEAGTLTAYAGGGFTWNPGAAPAGRYRFTYRLWAGGEQAASLGTVWIEYGNLYAETTVTGFAGQLAGFVQQGTRGTLNVSGYAGTVQTPFVAQGTRGTLTITGYAGTVTQGFETRGPFGQLVPQGFAGIFSNQFVGQGTACTLTVTGYAGTLTLTDFLNAAGTAGTLTVTGYAGSLSRFVEQGTAATVTVNGLAGTLQIGLAAIQGTGAALNVTGFAPVGLQRGRKVTRIRSGKRMRISR